MRVSSLFKFDSFFGSQYRVLLFGSRKSGLTPSLNTIKVVQRYQLKHSHENAEHHEARTEYPLAVG